MESKGLFRIGLIILIVVTTGVTLSKSWTMTCIMPEIPHNKDDTVLEEEPLNKRLDPFPRMPSSIENAMKMILDARTNSSRATFVQVGANDGEMFDQLYPHIKNVKHRWIGLQVEPQPNLFSQLAVLHADAPDWAFYHGAVAPSTLCTNGTIRFCETKTPGVGDWKTQGQLNSIEQKRCNSRTMHYKVRPCVSSFDELIKRHASPEFQKHAVSTTSTRQGKTASFHVDFLQIDVEGRDYDLLQLVDWDTMYPQCIGYEHVHLGANAAKAEQLLESKNYISVKTGMDVLACRVQKT